MSGARAPRPARSRSTCDASPDEEKPVMRMRAMALLVGALFCGCSASSMKATPIWDDDFARAEGPSEDRINVWPLLYYRNPALSVLWPLFSSSDEGQELVPL